MCLNQIFKDEQLAIMRYTLAPNGPDVGASLRALYRLRLDFQPFLIPTAPMSPIGRLCR
jgi:hypothetical protein